MHRMCNDVYFSMRSRTLTNLLAMPVSCLKGPLRDVMISRHQLQSCLSWVNEDTYPESDSEVIFIAALARVHVHRRPDAHWWHRNVGHEQELGPICNV